MIFYLPDAADTGLLFRVFAATYYGLVALVSCVVVLALCFFIFGLAWPAFQRVNDSYGQSGKQTRPWRGLGIRLILLTVIVFTSLVSEPWLLAQLWPWVVMLLSEIAAVFLYIYGARKVAKTTEVLLVD